MKKIIIGLIFCISLFLIHVSANTTDNKAPVLNSITFNSTSVNPGDDLYFNIDASDDVSGISDIDITFMNMDSGDSFSDNITYSKSKMHLQVPKYIPSGKYYIHNVRISDNSGNERYYYYDNEDCSVCFYPRDWEKKNFNQIITINSVGNDRTPPIITDVNISSNKLSNPNANLIVDVHVTDEQSDIDHISICVYNQKHGSYQCFEDGGYYDVANNTYSLILSASDFRYNGIYTVDSISAYDYAGNRSEVSSCITRNGVSNCGSANPHVKFLNKLINMSFTVSGLAEIEDNEAPIYKSIKLSKNNVTPPSVVEIELVADDVSGLSDEMDIVFTGKNDSSKILRALLSYNSENLRYEGILDINQYVAEDEYQLSSFQLCDKVDNCITYGIPDGSKWDELIDKNIEDNIVIKVKSNMYDVITSTTAKDMLEKIKNSSKNAKISIDSTNNPNIPKEVFEAIKDTNRTIYIETNGIEWIFNGKDIKTPKDINVEVNIDMIYNHNDKNLIDRLDKALVIDFADNGELPGIAMIRIKADYTFRNYIGLENLYVYYYNEKTKMFDKIATKMDANDYYYEFYISHNSIYTLTNSKIDNQYITDNKTDLKINTKAKAKTKKRKNDYNIPIWIGSISIIIIIIILIIKKKIKSRRTLIK